MTTTFALGAQPVRRIGFGAMQIPGPGVWGPPADRDAALSVLRRAVALGVDHIDTAQFYGPDVANELIRSALHPYPAGLRIVTKVGAARGADASWQPAAAPAQLRSQVEANLRTLALERLDVVNLRLAEPGSLEDSGVPLEESLGALCDLRDEGKIESIGLSAATVAELEAARALTPIACVQNRFNLLDRFGAAELEACSRLGIAFVPFFPLGSAFGGGAARLLGHPTVAAIAAAHEATPAQVALAWLLGLADNVLLIPGTSSLAHLEENLAAGDLELSDAERADLDAAADPAPTTAATG